MIKYLLCCLSLIIGISCKPDRPEDVLKADLVVQNGLIWTGLDGQAQAKAMAVKGDTILALSATASLDEHIGVQTRVIDAQGQLITPGFIDAHVHFLTGGFRLSSVQLRPAQSPEQFIAILKDYVSRLDSGEWVTGGDWDHENWGGILPRRDWIDSISPHNPVWIDRLDGHMALANSLALQSGGVDQYTREVAGGTIVKDQQGKPTGILKDNAMELVGQKVSQPSEQMKQKALKMAMDYVAKQGVTSVHTMGTWDELEVYEKAHDKAELTTRIYAAVPLSTWSELKQKIDQDGAGDKFLKIGGLKGFVDGSLGSHTAAFFDPFEDAPDNNGLLVNSREDLYQWTKMADQAGLQVMIHAIGDRANHLLLDIYEQVIKENGPKDRRFRIEHAQHLTREDIPRFAQLEVIPSMQPYHAIDDGRWAEKIIGPERIKTTYAFRDLLDSGSRLAFGSDWFVAPPTPLEGIYAATTRRTLDDQNPAGWVPEQKISVEEALRAYTIDPAYAAFEEDIKGTLEKGKLADFVILDQHILDLEPSQINQAEVVMTVVGGKIVYERSPMLFDDRRTDDQ